MPILNCPIRSRAISSPSSIAVYLPKAKITYAQLDQMINETKLQLQQQGLGLNDPVAFCDDNSLMLVVSTFAVIRLGGIFCPISHRLTPLEIKERLKTAGIKHIWHAQGETIAGQTVVNLNCDKGEYELLSTSETTEKPLENIAVNGDDPATIIFTSGSTGQPKAAVHSLNNHYYSAVGSTSVIPLNQQDCWLASLPISHIGGLAILMRCFIAGASIALVDRKNLLDSLLLYPISHASLVPTQLHRLLKQYKPLDQQQSLTKKTLKLKFLLLGGAAISPKLLTQAAAIGLSTFHSYGLTEMCSQVATSPAKSSYFSAALPYRHWKIVEGEIALSGETLFLGYMVAGVIMPACKNGWFYSKDLARNTPQGVEILGRKDNMFIVGGENYQPESIEAIINSYPAVENALIVAVKDDEFGTIPVAFVDWKAAEEVAKLTAYLTDKISRIKIPKHFLVWPKNTTETLKPNRKWYQQQAEKLILNDTKLEQ